MHFFQSYERDDQHSVSINGENFLDDHSDCRLITDMLHLVSRRHDDTTVAAALLLLILMPA
jgi:hypothetical protein